MTEQIGWGSAPGPQTPKITPGVPIFRIWAPSTGHMSIRPLQLFSISDLQTSSSRLQIAVGRSPELTLSSVVTKFLQNFLRKLFGPNSPVIFFYKLLFEVLKMLFKTFFVVKIAVCLKKSGIFVPYSRIIFEKLCLKKAFPCFVRVFIFSTLIIV